MTREPKVEIVKPAANGNGNGNGHVNSNGNHKTNGHATAPAITAERPAPAEEDNFFAQNGDDVLLEIDDIKGTFKKF
jgi:hypothetical protein